MSAIEAPVSELARLSEFRNEPYADFNRPEVRERYQEALHRVRGQLGREYACRIGGEERRVGKTFASLNPSNPREVIALHQEAGPELAGEAVEAAVRMFECWRLSAAEKRAGILLRAAELLRQRKPEFAAWMVLETGKTWPEAEADVAEAIDFCEYYARLALKLAGPQPVVQLAGERDELFYLPLGVVVVIPPWNFPLAIMAGMTTAAWVAGNTVVLKPSSDAATIAAEFVNLLREAGLPDGVVNLVTGGGTTVGRALVEDARVAMIAFTGSKAAGLDIQQRAAEPRQGQPWIKRVILELGGKDAILVDAETDLAAAVEGVAASAFGYQGQKCSACSRAIVHEKIYPRFLDMLAERAAKIQVGAAEDFSNQMGPVINEGALRKILGYIETGKQEGRLIHGGERVAGTGYFLAPTIFADVQPRARIAQEEIFGPVLAVIRCRDFTHGLEIANDTEYGLTGAIYTRDREKIERAKREFHTGNLYINRKCTGAMVGAHPFGGFKMSGTNSKAGGPDYLLLFTQAKSVAEKI